MKLFEKSLVFVFASEGGFSNHPNECGGATNIGITESTQIRAHAKGIVSYSGIKNLKGVETAVIYFEL